MGVNLEVWCVKDSLSQVGENVFGAIAEELFVKREACANDGFQLSADSITKLCVFPFDRTPRVHLKRLGNVFEGLATQSSCKEEQQLVFPIRMLA